MLRGNSPAKIDDRGRLKIPNGFRTLVESQYGPKLFVTSLTGFLLLAFRERAIMSALLIVHLGAVLALFVTLPYGKFVHGLYRAAALFTHAQESRRR